MKDTLFERSFFYSRKEQLWFVAALLATALLHLLPFFKVGFTTSDDVQYYVTAQQSWQYWLMDHQCYAEHQGRFYFLITKFFYYIPYLADNFAVAKAVQYITLLTSYILFAYLTYRILRSQAIGLLTLLLLVFNTCVNKAGYFIAVTSYPFFFSFSFIIFLSGVLLLVNYYQRGGRWQPMWASALFFVSALFYENYLVFILLIAAYIVVRNLRRNGVRRLWTKSSFWRELLPMVIAVVAYVAIYIGYRRWLAATMPEVAFYSGASLSDGRGFDMGKFFRVIVRCTTVALPGQNYFLSKHMVADNALSLSGFRNNPWFILTHSSVSVVVTALLQSGLLVWILRRSKFENTSWHRLAAIFFGALLFAFSANALIAVTPKYQDWSSWLWGYVTSFYSFFGIAAALGALVAITVKLVRHVLWRRVVCGLWTFLFFFTSVIIGFGNEHLSREWQRSQLRFVAIDEMAEDGAFDDLPANALLYTEGLHTISSTSYAITEGTMDMENYIELRSGRKFDYAIDSASYAEKLAENPDAPCFHINAITTQKSNELLVSIAGKHGANCFYLSPHKSFNLFYKDGDTWVKKAVVSEHPHRKATQVRLRGNAIDPTSFYVSNMEPWQR